MHSRIIQIESFPVNEDDRITEDTYIGDHWFVERIADYVAHDDNRDGTIEWLKESFSAATSFIRYFSDETGEGFVLKEGFHTAYFASEYEAFTKELHAFCEKLSSESYANGSLNSALFSLETAYDDEYGFYIENDGTGLVTLNRFLRYAKADTKYYFGGTVDYHW